MNVIAVVGRAHCHIASTMGNSPSHRSPESTSQPAAMPGAETPTTGITVDAVPSRSAVLCGVEQTMNVLVRIQTPPTPLAARPSLHVACVLDKSGSMSGQKLTFAKRAVRKLVRHLDPSCKLAFVTYDRSVERVFVDGDLSDEGKPELTAQIKAVRPGSTTNLHGGLQEGAACLRELSHSSNATPAARRIFLFSDGLVNAGVTQSGAILDAVDGFVREGITVSSFGIGTDFDESLMTRIAEHGRGK